MAEQQGFFRRIFSFGQPEADRTPEPGDMPGVNDTEAKRDASPDADIHHPATASTDTDTEAGADLDAPDGGGIEPLNPISAPATTEKKTLRYLN